jgi:hypothetical protein
MDHLLSNFNSFSLGTGGLSPENLFSKSRSDFLYQPGSRILVVGVPSWGQTLFKWRFVKKWAKRSGVSFLGYEFPRGILSDDHRLTKEIFSKISTAIRSDISRLMEKYKFDRCVVVGISLGTSYGSMIYKDNPLVTDIILVCPGNNLGLNMWNSIRTQHLKRSYEKQGLSSGELEKHWHDLSAENNMPHSDARIAIIYAMHDRVIPYSEAKALSEKLLEKNISLSEEKYQLGHYLLAVYFLLFPEQIMNKYVFD